MTTFWYVDALLPFVFEGYFMEVKFESNLHSAREHIPRYISLLAFTDGTLHIKLLFGWIINLV